MSTRILALLATAASALALAGGITAANAAPAAPPPAPEPSALAPAESPPAAASPSSPASTPASPSGTAAPGKEPAAQDEDVKADAALEECRDADCKIEIKDGQTITLDKGHGAESIGVELKGTRVTFTVRNGKSRAVTSMPTDGHHTTANFNGLTLHPHRGADGKLMLEISHS
ncbi:hypothetical protein [Actinomadura sp. KC345]|uniref:hypothetical protein n=1 Tax=Actinomadura sp. KC345 TaxID=2530371 RepID=UPI001404D0BE|nr:hypothetical protein [Actinomadura sp. KC345]